MNKYKDSHKELLENITNQCNIDPEKCAASLEDLYSKILNSQTEKNNAMSSIETTITELRKGASDNMRLVEQVRILEEQIKVLQSKNLDTITLELNKKIKELQGELLKKDSNLEHIKQLVSSFQNKIKDFGGWYAVNDEYILAPIYDALNINSPINDDYITLFNVKHNPAEERFWLYTP